MSEYPQANFLSSAHRVDQFVEDVGAEVAFAGRSNSGKSSAINAILNRRNLARTAKTPGRTQLINFFSVRQGQRLVDLPGYGYARVSKQLQRHWQQLLDGYFDRRHSLAGLFIVVDSRRALGDFDWRMLDWAGRIGFPAHVLLTKADKLNREESAAALTNARRELRDEASAQLFSATKTLGVDKARARLEEFLRSYRRQAS
ncbi:MAG: ribosome biogenesis GTP-binding protein YihA/YsxC [Pseudomonadota bacterium]|nr:ribosome biogenesis GTP-binding protein YihA/YsxC [Pseudomonadota bacterium]